MKSVNIRPLGGKVTTRPHALVSRLVSCTALALLATQPCSAQTVAEVFAFSSTYSSPTPLYVTPTQGRDGALYGTTSGVGSPQTDGTVFRATTAGKEKTVVSFTGDDGESPYTGVTLATDGNFYGTASLGGEFGYGVLFKLTPSGVYTALYEFTGGADGGYPVGLVEASDGYIYGTTAGTATAATVYRYSLSSGSLSTIFTFNGDNSQGSQIEAPLVQGTDGNLYGTANAGGTNNCGTVFKVSRSGTLIYDYSFPCGRGGAYPLGALIQASDGNFYGTTESGGVGCKPNGCGIVFKMTPAGSVSVLYSFAGGRNDGSDPAAGLAEGTDGNLYGDTASGGVSGYGTLYNITTYGTEALLYSFPLRIGEHPTATLLQDTNGEFYGTTQLGGAYEEGSLYSLNMGLGPFAAFVLPTGAAGKSAQILGQGFTGTTAVTFNGVPAASFKVASDTFLTAVVPSGATTGKVVVTTPGGTLTSNVNFRIIN